MNHDPFPFADFQRAATHLEQVLLDADDPYLLLTGETGTGKTALLDELRKKLDRSRYRTMYFAHARQLGASGLVRVLARMLRVSLGRSHAETVRALSQQLHDDSQRLLLCLDEAHDLPDETFFEAQSLVESRLGQGRPLVVFLIGLPPLRERLQAIPSLWRRIGAREEITGLTRDEVTPFLEHHFPDLARTPLCDEGRLLLFERGRGIPGFILPMFRSLLAEHRGKGVIPPVQLEDLLQRWDLP